MIASRFGGDRIRLTGFARAFSFQLSKWTVQPTTRSLGRNLWSKTLFLPKQARRELMGIEERRIRRRAYRSTAWSWPHRGRPRRLYA